MPRRKLPPGTPPGPPLDGHAPAAMTDPRSRGNPKHYKLDDIDDACALCVPVWDSGGWHHERSCPARRRLGRARRPAYGPNTSSLASRAYKPLALSQQPRCTHR